MNEYKLIKIGNKKIPATIKEFAFDGCHKIYLVDGKQAKQAFLDTGWEEKDFYKMKGTNLEECYWNTCPLRFIDLDSLHGFQTIIPQCANRTTFTYQNKSGNIIKHILDIRKDKIISVRC